MMNTYKKQLINMKKKMKNNNNLLMKWKKMVFKWFMTIIQILIQKKQHFKSMKLQKNVRQEKERVINVLFNQKKKMTKKKLNLRKKF